MLMVGAAVALMLALTWGGRRYGWASAQILALFGTSAALWVFFAWRVMTAQEPFIPLSVLRDGAMRVGTGAAFFAVGTVIALTIILPLYAQLALGLSASGSALTIIALQGGATVTSIVGGAPARAASATTSECRSSGSCSRSRRSVPLALAPTGLSPAAALGLIAFVGLGLGPTFPFTIVVVQNAVAMHQLGVATGTMNFFRALGSTFIVAGFGAIVLAGAPVIRGVVGGGSADGGGRSRSLPVGIRRRGALSDHRAGLHSGARGASAARLVAAPGAGRLRRRASWLPCARVHCVRRPAA